MKFLIKDFFSKYDQIRRKLRIWSHLLKKSLMENFIFYVVNKAKVSIELTTASKQAPLLIHIEEKVTLTDHDYVIASKNKLIPSVICNMRVREKHFSGDAVTYSGPTGCTMRIAKHSDSTTYHHLQDLKHLQSFNIFDDIFDNDTSESKTVMLVIVSDDLDENTKYTKNIESNIDQIISINHFTTHDLDAFFLATNASGRSAFNRMERRMVKFSQECSGIVLPHVKFGSHLNSKGETIDPELKNKNFMHMGQTLT